MFDIGGWEFLVIIVIAIIVIGPKDLPATIRTVAGWVRKARGLARDFQSGLDDLARETELDKVGNDIQSGLGLDDVTDAGNSIRREIEHAVDPDSEIKEAFEGYDPPVDGDFGGDEDLDDYGPPPKIATKDDGAQPAAASGTVSETHAGTAEQRPTGAAEKA